MVQQGILAFYQGKIEECELIINEKTQNLRRLEAQRNALNSKGETMLDRACACTDTIDSRMYGRCRRRGDDGGDGDGDGGYNLEFLPCTFTHLTRVQFARYVRSFSCSRSRARMSAR